VAEACTIQGLAGLDVVDIAAGATHSLALTRAGAGPPPRLILSTTRGALVLVLTVSTM
jgi:hypothetical protein